MEVVFLDANVLFSAAYRPDAGLLRLWDLEDVELITSVYALEEARTNLEEAQQQERLDALTRSVRLVPEATGRPLPRGVDLPEDDRPILLAAIEAGATHLLTGDVTHFGPFFGQALRGVLILPPSRFLRGRSPAERGP